MKSITRTAQQIRVAVGPSAFVARSGGEEFVILDLLTLGAGAAIAEKNPGRDRGAGHAEGHRERRGGPPPTIDGMAAFEAIHARADETMYAAKRNGGNRIALAGAVDAAHHGRDEDEIPFRPPVLKDLDERDAESLGL